MISAAAGGDLAEVQALLAGGADPNAVVGEDEEHAGRTALIVASEKDHVEVVQALLAGGAHPDAAVVGGEDAVEGEGFTALMAASVRGHKEVVALLIEAGATVDAQNADGHSALMFAHNGASQVRALQSSYKDMMDSADPAVLASLGEAMDGHAAIVALLQRAGADSTLKDRENHRASDFNNSE